VLRFYLNLTQYLPVTVIDELFLFLYEAHDHVEEYLMKCREGFVHGEVLLNNHVTDPMAHNLAARHCS
jgi:hypothetical protein